MREMRGTCRGNERGYPVRHRGDARAGQVRYKRQKYGGAPQEIRHGVPPVFPTVPSRPSHAFNHTQHPP